MTLSHLMLAAAVLTFLMIMTASSLVTGLDMKLALGNRGDMPAPRPVGARADRAAKNMLENMILFLAVMFAASGGSHPDRAVLGAEIFVIARLVYWPIYLAGIQGLRTLLYWAGTVGLGIIASAAL